ncbi:hypothetical protein HC928_01410 [bacterium]|nr:hypothetical protein [bacterium]
MNALRFSASRTAPAFYTSLPRRVKQRRHIGIKPAYHLARVEATNIGRDDEARLA